MLSFLGETINIMTLGGLALAVGILVDDATVDHRKHRAQSGGRPRLCATAILEGAAQIAVPALVSTLCICIVFLPMFFLSGVARYLFVPLAEAVVFAMLASYVLSRTLVPTMAMYLLKRQAARRRPIAQSVRAAFSSGFERGFERLRARLSAAADRARVPPRASSSRCFSVLCLLRVFVLVPWLGQDFFPTTDSGQFILHLRAKTGTRIEETARLCDLVENVHPPRHSASETRQHPRQHRPALQQHQHHATATPALIGAGDADILVSLKREAPPHRRLRARAAPKLAARISRHRCSTSCRPTSSPRS